MNSILEALADDVPDSKFRLIKTKDEERGASAERSPQVFGRPINYMGQTKEERRFLMMMNSDAVLVLAGEDGTLMEAKIALAAGRPVVVIRNYGAVARYLASNKGTKNLPNLHVVDSLSEAVRVLKGIAESAK